MRTTFSAPGLGRRWAVTKAITSLGRTSSGSLLHHAEEDAQVVGIGPNRVRTGPADDELQELVDQVVADPIGVFTVGTDVTLERRTPLHRTPPGRACTRGGSPGCLSQEVDHMYNRERGHRLCQVYRLLRRSWTLRVDCLAPSQHLYRLFDASGSCLDLLCASDPIEDGVPVRTRELEKHRLSAGIGGQGDRQVFWNFHAGLSGVGGVPSTVGFRPPNLVFP